MEFQEQAHINFIRKYLWCDREYGRAAVMVGAGFSRNAEKVSSTVQSLPTWVDLCRLLYSELYKGDQFEIKSFSSAEVLRLAN